MYSGSENKYYVNDIGEVWYDPLELGLGPSDTI